MSFTKFKTPEPQLSHLYNSPERGKDNIYGLVCGMGSVIGVWDNFEWRVTQFYYSSKIIVLDLQILAITIIFLTNLSDKQDSPTGLSMHRMRKGVLVRLEAFQCSSKMKHIANDLRLLQDETELPILK